MARDRAQGSDHLETVRIVYLDFLKTARGNPKGDTDTTVSMPASPRIAVADEEAKTRTFLKVVNVFLESGTVS